MLPAPLVPLTVAQAGAAPQCMRRPCGDDGYHTVLDTKNVRAWCSYLVYGGAGAILITQPCPCPARPRGTHVLAARSHF